jgi:AraC-like DNA-binding protein
MSGADRIGKIGDLSVTSLNSVFEAEAATRQFGPLVVFGLKASPHRIASSRKCEPDLQESLLRLRYQRSGESVIEQAGIQRTLRAGEWTIIDGARPHSMINTKEASQISLHLPRSLLSDRDYRIATSIGGSLPMGGRVSNLLFECLCFSIEELGVTSELTEQELGLSILGMFRVAINEVASEQQRSTSREAVEKRVRDYIHRNLSDPDLSVEAIARAMGCTARYIHKIFEGKESVSRMIWSQRLDRCRLELQSVRGASLTLTELAYEFGFSSSAHFSRTFKERFGVTPSAFRVRVIEGQVGENSVN